MEAGALLRDLPDPPRIVFATANEDASIASAASALGASPDVRCRRRPEPIDVGNRPDAERFEDTINPIVDKAAGSRKRLVRIYGEMVDVWWSSGREDAAPSLDILQACPMPLEYR